MTSTTSPAHRGGRAVVWAALPMVLFLTIPLIALLLRLPPRAILQALNEQKVIQAITLTLTTSLTTTFLGIVMGLPLAWVLARRQFRGRAIVETVVDLPIVLPPAVAGIALLMTFGRRGLIGQLLNTAGVSIVFTPTAVVLAQLFVASPFFIRAAASGLANVERHLEEAAMLDGATSFESFRYIIAPRIFPILISGAVMMWARAVGEFGATIIFAGNFPGRTQTMPLAIYLGFEMDLAVSLTLSAILLGMAFTVLLVVKRVLHRQLSPTGD